MAKAAPAYLETDAARNLPLYERAGFEKTRELRVLDVPVFIMRRSPRPPYRKARPS